MAFVASAATRGKGLAYAAGEAASLPFPWCLPSLPRPRHPRPRVWPRPQARGGADRGWRDMRVRHPDLISGALLLVFGLSTAGESLRLPLGSLADSGPGLCPLALG